MSNPPQPDKRRGKRPIAFFVIILVAVVAVVIGAFVSLPKNALSVDWSFTAQNESGPGSGGYVNVHLVIYNHGDSDVNCTVHLRVFDGYIWHDYTTPLGVIPAGGEHTLDWGANYLSMDENKVRVEKTLTAD